MKRAPLSPVPAVRSVALWAGGAVAALMPGLLGVLVAGRAAGAPGAADPALFTRDIQPLLRRYCVGCHGPGKPAGGIDLASWADLRALQKDPTTWRKVLVQVRDAAMPPRNAPQPAPEERERLADAIRHALESTPDDLIPPDPGPSLVRRLNRTEYNNTVRDLFGVHSRPADRFPADGGGGAGFDNNAATLFLPPILMERYLQAAEEILAEAPPQRLFFVRPGAPKGVSARQAARRILEHYATRAFRRPVELEELAGLMRLYDAAARREPFEQAVRRALKAVLVSPSFLFRIERSRGSSQPYPVNDWELASRLSYFLWASMPDEELFRLARAGRLRDPKVLEAQVRRMLRDPKARALSESFAGQWLRIRELQSVQPDPRRFPAYTPSLRDAMAAETIAFVDSVLRGDASLLLLLDADYTFLNEELAKHYGIEGVRGPELRRVALPDRRRGGVLTMASVLTITSYPQRTSPVLRGKWVLEEILGTPVPPPPPNAGGLPADDAPKQGLTFRQRLELHRQKPECASCHSRMDPVGFALENFDAIGRWRTHIGSEPVDAAAVFPTGERVAGPEELKRLILARREDFARNLAERMLSYALGRGVEHCDLPALRRILTALKQENYRSGVLIREIVMSYPFRYRKD